MESFMHNFEENEFLQQHGATFDYETGYMHGTDDCRIRKENMVMITLLLISMIATLLMLIMRPCVWTHYRGGEQARLARFGPSMRGA
jgi:hypothetical protein